MNQNRFAPNGVGLSNQRLIDLNIQRRQNFLLNPDLVYPWYQKCTVKVLLVTDGGLNFGTGDFGLSTFVNILQNDAPSRVRFDLTLAHLRSDASNADVMSGAPGITRSIKGFRFDESSHFTPEMYDEVWLFGIVPGVALPGSSFVESFHMPNYEQRNNNKSKYPANRLGDAELNNLFAHANRDLDRGGGGGIFATGDHGALGKALCGSIPRVRSMRHWDSFPSSDSASDQVGINGPRRNDTNQVGHDTGTQFSDQSDDIPQRLDLVLYSTPLSELKSTRYPHPVLCGRNGRIDVLPDHPHEGECRVPTDVTLSFNDRNEYPVETGGSLRVTPEIIAYSHVPAGNTTASRSKTPTIAHSFAAISAYDGHDAGVGRIICDATWHHFINVNLIGVLEGARFDEFARPGEDASKHDGFLSSVDGLGAFDKIKNYYTNIGVWLAPPARQACFNRKAQWHLVYTDRIMESALTNPNVAFEKIPLDVFYSIGVHARDAFSRRASQCQTVEWQLDMFRKIMPEIVPLIDPWPPLGRPPKDPLPLPIFDPQPIVDVAIGAGLVTLRQAFPYPPEKFTDQIDEAAVGAMLKGARLGLDMAIKHAGDNWKAFSRALKI